MRFTPKASYWCSKDSQGGGPGPYSAPVGMVVTNSNESLPHTPYGSGAVWASAGSGALVHTWRSGRWFSWVMKTKTIEGRFDAGPGDVPATWLRARRSSRAAASPGGNIVIRNVRV